MSYKSKRKKDYPCLRCGNHVKMTEHAVKCALCDLWVHKSCENMDDATFNVLDLQNQMGQCFWTCKSCHSFAFKFEKRMKDIDKRLQLIEDKLPKVECDVTEIKTEIASLKSGMDNDQDKFIQIQSNAVDVVFEEMRDRESRKSNVVIHNLAEPPISVKSGTDRIAKDKVAVQDLCKVIGVDIDNVSAIKFAKRIGAKQDNPDEHRPLLVGFMSDETSHNVLDLSSGLKDLGDPWTNVNVIQDLTKKQRSEEKKMREEAAKRNKELSEDDAKNWLWKVVGRRGERHVVKAALSKEQTQASQSRKGRITGALPQRNLRSNQQTM